MKVPFLLIEHVFLPPLTFS